MPNYHLCALATFAALNKREAVEQEQGEGAGKQEQGAAQTLSAIFEAGGAAWPGLSILQRATFSRWQPLNFERFKLGGRGRGRGRVLVAGSRIALFAAT